MMQKRTIIILACIFFGCVFPLFIFWVTSHQKKSTSPAPELPPISVMPTTAFFQESIEDATVIGGVRVRNFLKTPQSVLPNGHLIMQQNDRYQIFYYPQSQGFLVSVLGQPFETAREQAEQELLRTLDISPDEVCRLNISITTPAYANPDHAGKIYRMSVCTPDESISGS